MRILGIDPGYAILGYGIVDMTGNRFTACDYGAVITEKDLDMPDRLKHIYSCLMEIIDEYRPDAVAIEELLIKCKNGAFGRAGEGVAILACKFRLEV